MHFFSGMTALVSGASSGLGLALAHSLVAAGARVAITGTSRSKLDAALEQFSDRSAVLPLAFDVSDEAAWRLAESRVRAEFGPIRFLVLNAGVGMGGDRIEDTPSDIWRWAWQINVMGVVHGLQACLPHMRADGLESHVMATSSVAGVWRCPSVGPYGVTKAAVVALAESLRIELAGTRVGCSVLLPGKIRTALPETSKRSAPLKLSPTLVDAMTSFLADGLDPNDVAAYALDRVRAGAFYIFTHPQIDDEIAARQSELAQAMTTTISR